MNKRRNKINVQDVADTMDISVYQALDNAQYCNEITADGEYPSGELSYHINRYIVHYCKEIIDTMLTLL